MEKQNIRNRTNIKNKDVYATFLKFKHIIISSTDMEEKGVYIK